VISKFKPEVSIIITTHNRPHMLARAIESAREASQGDVEVVVVDDASSDETASVCCSISDINYVRVERNQGVAGARNLGILASHGDYLSFLDDDDLRLPGSLDRQVEALAPFPESGFIYGQALLSNQDGMATGDIYPALCPQGDVFWELLAQNFVPCGATVFRRSCLFRVGLLDDAIPGIDDWDLWLRLAELYTVRALTEPVMIWRQSTPVSGQGTSRAVEMVKLCNLQLRNHWLELPRVAKSSKGERRAAERKLSGNMAKHLLWAAWRALAAGQLLNSQRSLLAACRLYPEEIARMAIHPSGFSSLLTHAHSEWHALRTNGNGNHLRGPDVESGNEDHARQRPVQRPN
jgi:glycosyltransferase involved in cell wall biosynthesis